MPSKVIGICFFLGSTGICFAGANPPGFVVSAGQDVHTQLLLLVQGPLHATYLTLWEWLQTGATEADKNTFVVMR